MGPILVFTARQSGLLQSDEQAKAVVKAMKTHLREPSVVILGEEDSMPKAVYPFYVVGIDAAGNLVGLKSGVVWT